MFTYEALECGKRAGRAGTTWLVAFGRGVRVGLCLWRSPLTRHRAARNTPGAAQPMFRSTPPIRAERLDYMVRDSGLRAVITEKPLLPALAAHVEAELL